MDVRAIRRDLGVVAQEAGFNVWPYVPDDPQDLPAAVVGGVKEMERLNKSVTRLQIGVTFYANAADPEDAQSTLDGAVSIGAGNDSFLDLLDEVKQQDGPAWTSACFAFCGPYQRYDMPEGVAWGVELTLELTA